MVESAASPSCFRSILEHDPTHVVGIGASAGGLAPLRTLLQRFTSDCSAFVVVMHLAPAHESHLTAILTRSTALSVATATNGQVLRKNSIYVIPPGFLLRLTEEGTLSLAALPATYPRWTIDLFFQSLSEIGSAAIGLLLSGNGSDGTLGLEAIQARGGATFVQDPASATNPDMPQSGRPFADYCLPPRALGDVLMRTIGATPKDAASGVLARTSFL